MITPTLVVMGLGTCFLVASLLINKLVKTDYKRDVYGLIFTGIYMGLFLAQLIYDLMR